MRSDTPGETGGDIAAISNRVLVTGLVGYTPSIG